MLPYIITFIVSLILFRWADKYRNISTFCCAMGVFLLALLAGVRDNTIGTDTAMYVTDVFNYAHMYRNDLDFLLYRVNGVEGGYVFFNYLIVLLTDSLNGYLFIAHGLMITMTVCAVRKFGLRTFLPMFVYLFLYFNSSLNAHRQYLAMSFCLLAFAQLYRQLSWWKIALTMTIAYGFHHSSLLFGLILLFYVLVHKHQTWFDNWKIKLLFVVGTIASIYSVNAWLEAMIGLGIGDMKYLERYGSSDVYGTNLPISVIALTVFNYGAFCLCRWKVPKAVQSSALICFADYIFLLCILLCGTALISTFLIRIETYFEILSILLIPYYVYLSRSKWLKYTFIFFYLFVFYMTVYVADLGDSVPYTSKILGI